MKVILISGKAQHGKDTVASIINYRLKSDGNNVLITHYADLLKYICKSYLGWDGNKDDNGRKLLQYVGTDIVRKKNPTLWVDFVSQMLSYFGGIWDYVIIPDCRFPNEISTIVNDGFDVTYLRVVRNNFISPLTDNQQQHLSETALDDIVPDYYIYNDGTIEELEDIIDKWIKGDLYHE